MGGRKAQWCFRNATFRYKRLGFAGLEDEMPAGVRGGRRKRKGRVDLHRAWYVIKRG